MSGKPRTQLSGVQRVFLLDAACGLTSAETARKHGQTQDTVRNALKAARRILGALSTTHAVALAHDLFTPQELRDIRDSSTRTNGH